MNHLETAYFAGGCFWCLEAAFSRVTGVSSIISGYAGGITSEPTYEQVCSGHTGHAEVVQINFDPKIVSYEKLLELFFKLHNPTSLNRQGNDIGTQYRSAIFYANDEQKVAAKNSINYLHQEKVFAKPIVTEIAPLKHFYPAEEYHQKYFEKNPEAAYCQLVIAPKLEKLKSLEIV